MYNLSGIFLLKIKYRIIGCRKKFYNILKLIYLHLCSISHIIVIFRNRLLSGNLILFTSAVINEKSKQIMQNKIKEKVYENKIRRLFNYIGNSLFIIIMFRSYGTK